MSEEKDVLTHDQGALKDRLQSNNKEESIEFYYELLSSGHSVGDILKKVGGTQSKFVHSNTETADNLLESFDKVTTEIKFKHEIEADVLAAGQTRHPRELDTAVKSSVAAALAEPTETAAQREAS